MPSLNTQVLKMNIPPSQCELFPNIFENIIEFLDVIEIDIVNCQDDNSPLLYSLLFYYNQSIYYQDLIASQLYNNFLLIPPQNTSKLKLAFPFLSNNLGILVVNIHDSFGGIVNISTTIQIKEYINIDETIFESYLHNQQGENYKLIGYRIVVERLSRMNTMIDYIAKLFHELITYDQNQTLLSNQTESLYHSISILLTQNVTLLNNTEEQLSYQLNYRISLASKQLVYFTDLQKKNKLNSNQNIEKANFVMQYYSFTHILSSYINYRVASNKSSTEIQDQLNTMMIQLQEISVANEPLYKVMSNSVNLNFGFLTQKMADQITGQSSTLNKKIDDSTDSASSQNTSTSFYQYSQTRYLDNPFYATEGFPKNSSGYQAVDPKLQQQNGTSQSKGALKVPMKFQFPISKKNDNTSLKCIATVDNANWNADVCKTVNNSGVITCQCDSLNPTSIMESLDFILDKASQVYSLDTLAAFLSFPFYKTIVFYFYAIITCAYLYIIYWGMKVDNVMFERIQQEKDIAEQQLKEEEEMIENMKHAQEENLLIVNQNQVQQDPDAPELKTIFTRKRNGIMMIRNEEIKNQPNSPRERIASQHSYQSHQLYDEPENDVQLIKDIDRDSRQEKIIPLFNQQDCSPDTNREISDKENVRRSDKKKDSYNERTKMSVQDSISKLKAYIEYLKLFHQILSIIYKDDEEKPRGLRASIVYTSIMGSLAVLFVFNQPNNLTITIALAIITAPINKIYQVILEKLLAHKKKSVRYGGALFMIVTAGFISYTMLAGLVLSGSVETANQWSYIFIGTFSVDNLIYSPLQLVFQYGIHMGLLNLPKIKNLLNKLLDEKAKELLKKIFRKGK